MSEHQWGALALVPVTVLVAWCVVPVMVMAARDIATGRTKARAK